MSSVAARTLALLPGYTRRETHYRYLWNTECECRAGSKCAVVSTVFGFGRLATLATYATFEQCLVDRQAKNGFCTQNSTYQPSSAPIRRR